MEWEDRKTGGKRRIIQWHEERGGKPERGLELREEDQRES